MQSWPSKHVIRTKKVNADSVLSVASVECESALAR